jgi:hypothetical protein
VSETETDVVSDRVADRGADEVHVDDWVNVNDGDPCVAEGSSVRLELNVNTVRESEAVSERVPVKKGDAVGDLDFVAVADGVSSLSVTEVVGDGLGPDTV